MHEKLVSYLLGELGPAEAEELERRLAEDPDLAAELRRIRGCLPPESGERGADEPDAAAPAAPTDPADAPDGLADRTADSVSMLAAELSRRDQGGSADSGSADSGDAHNRGGVDEPAGRRCSLTLLDAAVAIGVVAAVGMMLVPALRESRESARRIACNNNLRQLGQALQQYADDHGGYFPMIHPNATAGSFTIDLADGGYLNREDLAELVVCPASREAELVDSGQLTVEVPTWGELNQTTGQRLAMLQRVMSLSFAYRLPYVKNNRYMALRRESGVAAPLLSDAPTLVDNQWRSLNHGGCVQNVLLSDGSVRPVSDCRAPAGLDHLFVNAAGRTEAASQWNDTVLVRSDFAPRFTSSATVIRLRGSFRAQIRVRTPSPVDAD